MKFYFCIHLSLLFLSATAQQQTFDVISFKQPAGWTKQTSAQTIQLAKENASTGAYCLIMLFKSMPGTTNSKDNFTAAWDALVKEMVTIKTKPDMQEPGSDNGWEIQSGLAPFEKDEQKGIALLATATASGKMVNILVLTNTDTYQQEISDFMEAVVLSKPTGKTDIGGLATKPTNTVSQKPSTGIKDGFAFNTTNFDDGWNSTVQPDWVEVVKGNIKVLLHYPKQGTIFPADPAPLTNAAWNILVAPHYRDLKNYKTTYISDYQRVYMSSGFATETSTGKEVYIVFFRQGDTGWLEFVCPDKNTFIQYFKFNPDNVRWDTEVNLMKPLSAMVNYNKFAVAASDLKGSWTSDFTGVQQLYNVYTGNYAGMNINQSSEDFVFGSGNTYSWKILAVNGMVGNLKFGQAASSGTFTMKGNWQIYFSKIESSAKTYNVHWSCIKGGRILWLQDQKSGSFTSYGKKIAK